MPQPLVSIIVPAYNAARYIREAVDSALGQTYGNKEIIVIDDGSIDNTRSELTEYISRGDIRYIYQENRGLSAARNAGIHAAGGEYVALLDADDVFLPEKIERQIAHFEQNPKCDVSYCDVRHFWDGEPERLYKLQYEYPSGSGYEMMEKLLNNFFIVPVSVVIRRSAFERFGYFDENLRRAEDLDFWLRLLNGGGTICHLPNVLARVRMRKEGNLQSLATQPAVKAAEVRVLERFFSSLSPEGKERIHAASQLARFRRKLGLMYLANGNKKSAREHLSGPLRIAGMITPAAILRGLLSFLYYRRRRSLLKVS